MVKELERQLLEKDSTIKEMSIEIQQLKEALSKISFQTANNVKDIDDSLDHSMLQNIMLNQTYILTVLN